MARDIRVGMIGLSEGNGHPFSFSAIINGYSDEGLRESGWPVIYEYVRRRDPSEFGIEGLNVTHAWTQDKDTTKRLCQACRISNEVSAPEDMIGQVDAVILARDDYENHFIMAMPFLKAGLAVFVDKPLSLNIGELRAFTPYLESGRLFSCSAMRYARELDDIRVSLKNYGELKLLRGTILNTWEKYGVHLVDAIISILGKTPKWVCALDADHMSISMGVHDGPLIQVDTLGEVSKTFRIDLWGTHASSSHEITDNFSMFRRMLWHFSRSIKTGVSAIPPNETLGIMRIIMAGKISKREKRAVYLDEFPV
jgi:hypothetical protein